MAEKTFIDYARGFGLIGYPLSHSFSKKYFSEKFAREGIEDARYELFPLEDIAGLPDLWQRYPNLRGLNVTIPHKQAVMAYLDDLDPAAAAVGAVNTIRISDGKRMGYNTDIYGFEQSLRKKLAETNLNLGQALVLGTGGAAKAVVYVLQQMNIHPVLVSRRAASGQLTYGELPKESMDDFPMIVNTTPLGMHPRVDQCPDIPYEELGPGHLLYDLVYNPAETLFMRRGAAQGAFTINGLNMLILQAEKAWEIWNT